jgi:hypothetical protein
MINRLKKFNAERNIFNEEENMELAELTEKLKVATGYMVTISILTEAGKIEHSLLTNNFPKVDMLLSHNYVKKLIIKNLEEDRPLLYD